MQALLLLIAAFVTRGALFGNPLVHSDEGFYPLVGDRMMHGAWPFVDIFDRKPVGLFLIFAAIRSVAAAAGLDDRGCTLRLRRCVAILAIGLTLAALVKTLRIRQRGTPAQATALARMVGDRPAGCVFGFNSEPILYYLTRSCLPTRYICRSHLGQTSEIHGIDADPVAETARILARDPGVIVIRTPKPTTNPATQAVVWRAVADRYRLIGTVGIGRLRQYVFRLRRQRR